MITGAGSGIGEALTRLLAAEGAVIYALDVRAARLEELARDLGGQTAFHTIPVDVAKRDEMAAAAKRIHGEAGKVDLLINNAGVTMLAETAEVSFAEWRKILDVNFLGVLHGVHFFYPAMAKCRSGQIANIASIAGAGGYASAQAYATSKGAVIGFTRSLEVEAKTHNVQVSNVCPSYVETRIFGDALDEDWTEDAIRKTFMTNPISSEKAAQAILQGIRKRKKTIVFPLSGRLLYWITGWLPPFLRPLQNTLLKRYRSAKG